MKSRGDYGTSLVFWQREQVIRPHAVCVGADVWGVPIDYSNACDTSVGTRDEGLAPVTDPSHHF
jgi:hypothetical protein